MKQEKTNFDEEIQIIDAENEFEFDVESKYFRVYFVKPLLKDDPHFEFSYREGKSIFKIKSQTIQGKLINIKRSSYTYEGQEINTLKFNIEYTNSKNQLMLFVLGTSYTNMSRSLINSLLSVDQPIEKINLSIYTNRDGYASVYALFNGKKVPWKYDINYQKSLIEEIKNKRGELVSRDYTELNTFLEDELFQHINVIIPNHRVEIPEGDANSFLEAEPEDEKKIKAKKSRSINFEKSLDKEEDILKEEEDDDFFKIDEND